jgi:hypothetical protein
MLRFMKPKVVRDAEEMGFRWECQFATGWKTCRTDGNSFRRTRLKSCSDDRTTWVVQGDRIRREGRMLRFMKPKVVRDALRPWGTRQTGSSSPRDGSEPADGCGFRFMKPKAVPAAGEGGFRWACQFATGWKTYRTNGNSFRRTRLKSCSDDRTTWVVQGDRVRKEGHMLRFMKPKVPRDALRPRGTRQTGSSSPRDESEPADGCGLRFMKPKAVPAAGEGGFRWACQFATGWKTYRTDGTPFRRTRLKSCSDSKTTWVVQGDRVRKEGHMLRFMKPKVVRGMPRRRGLDKLEVRRHGMDRNLLMGSDSAL